MTDPINVACPACAAVAPEPCRSPRSGRLLHDYYHPSRREAAGQPVRP